jgi:predicted RNA-binding Zn-ribbon protein involved in translation (DUF1610 family)
MKIGHEFTFTCPKCGETFMVEADVKPPECFDCAWSDLEILREIISPF